MAKIKIEGLSAEEILTAERLQSSSYHILQSLRWLDYVKRHQLGNALHYAAIELRYGLEDLLFELLVLSNHGLSEQEYKKSIGTPEKRRRMLESNEKRYSTLSNFTEIVHSEDTTPGKPKMTFWKLSEIFKHLGTASEYLHFCGVHRLTYDNEVWLLQAVAKLERVALIYWKAATQTAGCVLMAIDQMPQITRTLWEKYSKGEVNEQYIRECLRISRPVTDWEKENLFRF